MAEPDGKAEEAVEGAGDGAAAGLLQRGTAAKEELLGGRDPRGLQKE